MNKELLKKTFKEYKKAAKVDYAITAPDAYGDCSSCVNDALCDRYGETSKGVWVKEWTHGMNKGADIAELDSVIVAHDLTEDQAAIFYEVLGAKYNITPSAFNPAVCFELFEKGTEVFEISYNDEWGGEKRHYTDNYTDFDKAARRFRKLLDMGYDAEMRRLFKGER